MRFDELVRQCKGVYQGRQLHRLILDAGGHGHDVYLSNLLVQMYGRSGSPEEAHNVFDSIRHPNHFSWSLLMHAYAQNGHLLQTEAVFKLMPQRDPVTWNAMITSYSQSSSIQHAKCTFDSAPQRNVISWNTMFTAYAENGHLQHATKTFQKMPQHDIVSLNARLASSQDPRRVLELFRDTPERNAISWSLVVQAQAQECRMQEAERLLRKMPQWNVYPWNAVLAGYGRSGEVTEARRVFEEMAERDVASWTSLLDSYAQSGQWQEAGSVFSQMPRRNVFSWTALLSAFAQSRLVEESRSTFQRMPQHTLVSWNAMIMTYASNGDFPLASHTFACAPQRDVTSWTILLTSCTGLPEDVPRAELLLHLMPAHGLHPWNAFLSLLSRLGRLSDVEKLFRQRMHERDVVSWSLLASALVNAGKLTAACDILYEMSLEGILPDGTCFTNVLAACKDAGSIDRCREVFTSMQIDFSIAPGADHFGCMVDALARSGEVADARELVERMTVVPGDVSRTAVLSGCIGTEEVEVGRAVASEGNDRTSGSSSAVYVSLSNMYAAGAWRSRGRFKDTLHASSDKRQVV